MASYSETLERIYNLHGGAIDLRLDRVAGALKLFDHPERKFPSIHIAGTNGKGSTAAMLQRILSIAGYRTALYTSPHLVSFTERIKIDDEEISPERSRRDRRRDLAAHGGGRHRADLFRSRDGDGVYLFRPPPHRCGGYRGRPGRPFRCDQCDHAASRADHDDLKGS